MPLSKEFLLARRECCGLRCLYCPYRPRHQKGSRRIMPDSYYDTFVSLEEELIAMDIAKKLDK